MDSLSAEHLLYASPEIHTLLAICFNAFIVHGFLPSYLTDSVIIPIVKDKCKNISDAGNYPANMLTLGQRRQTLALERQRRRRVTTLAQRCSDDGWRRHRTTLSQRRVTMLAQRCSDDGWRRHSTTLSQRRVTMLAQRCSRDAKPTSGDDVGSTLFRRRLATSPDDAKPTSGDDVGSTLFRRRLATSPDDAKPTSNPFSAT